METALEWGIRHGSCKPALERRKKYASQPEWYEACDRGDWLFWQLQYAKLNDEHVAIIKRLTVDFAIRPVEAYALHCGIFEVEKWAQKWISGEDRTVEAATRAARAAWVTRAAEAVEVARAAAAAEAAWTAARAAWPAWAVETAEVVTEAARAAAEAARVAWVTRAAELKYQADAIHKAIPEWPGGKIINPSTSTHNI